MSVWTQTWVCISCIYTNICLYIKVCLCYDDGDDDYVCVCVRRVRWMVTPPSYAAWKWFQCNCIAVIASWRQLGFPILFSNRAQVMWRRRRNHMHNLSVFALWKPMCTRTVKANIITSPAEANVLCERTVGKKVYQCAVIKTQWANFSSRVSCPQSPSWYNERITKTLIWYIIVEDGELNTSIL